MMSRNTSSHARHLRVVLSVTATVIAVLAVAVASSSANPSNTRELFKGAPENAPPLVAGTTYRGSLISPTPTVTPSVPGWVGSQLVSHQSGKVRYERAALLWQQDPEGEIAIISGPAMTMSVAATIEQPRRRARYWKFDPYKPPTPIKRWKLGGRTALYFEGTDPGPSAWTLVGSNPAEDGRPSRPVVPARRSNSARPDRRHPDQGIRHCLRPIPSDRSAALDITQIPSLSA